MWHRNRQPLQLLLVLADLGLNFVKVERANSRCRQVRRQLEEVEEEASRERYKARQLQRNIDELSETNETLSRENAQLKTSAALARRSGMPRASSSRFGSNSYRS